MAEAWKDISNYEGLYQVSDKGRVRSFRGVEIRILKTHIRKRDGYEYVGLRDGTERKTVKVHRLVAAAFLRAPSNKKNKDPHHKNGNRADNRMKNLKWLSKSENSLIRHRPHGVCLTTGVSLSGSKTNPYRANICIRGKKTYLGVFHTVKAAQVARKKAYERRAYV